MNEDNMNRLYAAAKSGTLKDVKAAFEACSADERKEYGYKTLWGAETNPGPHTLEIMKFLIEQGAKPDSHTMTFTYVAGSHELDIMKLLEDNENRLYAAARFGTLEDVKAALETCSDDERKAYGYGTLRYAAQNIGPYALEIVEFLMEQHDRSGCPIDIDSDTLRDAAENRGPCALKIVEFLMGRGLNPDSDTLCWAAYNHGQYALFCAVSNTGPCALEIVKYLIERGIAPKSDTLSHAAGNSGPFALDIVKLLIERGVDRHERDYYESTAFLEALDYGNTDICDYLLSRDDFYLSDLMPRQQILFMSDDDPYTDGIYIKPNIDETYIKYKGESKTYKTYREKAISRVSELIDEKGPSYARTVAADIKKILEENEELEPPEEEDIEALQPLIKKIASIDWVGDAQVSCDDFLGCDVER